MGFQFRKSIKIAPGVKLNISKNGVSVIAGNKYVRATIGKKSNFNFYTWDGVYICEKAEKEIRSIEY